MEERPRKRAKQREPCACPICLDDCVPERSFALPCCNKGLAPEAEPQLLHKGCFFAYARSVFEAPAFAGRSLLLMPEEELQSLLRCPRCRGRLGVDREFGLAAPCRTTPNHTRDDSLHAWIRWPMDETIICESQLAMGASQIQEHTRFFNVVLSGDASPPDRGDSRFRERHQVTRRANGTPTSYVVLPSVSLEPKQEVLGYSIPQNPNGLILPSMARREEERRRFYATTLL